MKIKNISVQNFKAVSQESISFDGCSAIITAGNNKGKTSILRGLIDRFRGEKVDMIVKEGESKGFNLIELTDGCKIEWKFTEKTETFAYTTNEGIRMTQGVLSAIGQKYFGIKFDIDKFLSSGPQLQTKELQKIVGLDFDEIDSRYKEAYDDRTYANKVLADVVAKKLAEPEKVEKPEIEKLKSEWDDLDSKNLRLVSTWNAENDKLQHNISRFNQEQGDKRILYNDLVHAKVTLKKAGLHSEEIANFVESKKPQELREFKRTKEPTYHDTTAIKLKIEEANNQQRLFDSYERDLKQYSDWIAEGKQARFNQVKADEKVKSIQAEKNKMIVGASIPKEFEITEKGILYNGLPLTDSQISSSSKYIAALKLGSMVLGSLRTMHFDASFLDKNSLAEIQTWANENDLQLLIERPDFDGGEIKYQIIES